MNKTRLLQICSRALLLVIVAAVFLACAPSSTTAPATSSSPSTTSTADKLPPKPSTIRVGSYAVGSSSYLLDAGIGEGMLKTFDIRLRAMPVGSAVSRLSVLRQGSVDISIVSDILWATEGLVVYASLDWGPQQLRLVYQPSRASCYSLATSEASGIKTMADLKGKKVTYQVGSAASIALTLSCLQYAGLTWDDVIKVETPSLTAAYKAVIEGTADVSLLNSNSSAASELASSPKGIYWIPMPVEDAAAWDRVVSTAPIAYPIHAKVGPGLSADKPVWLQTFGFPTYATYASADPDFIYWSVKAYVESWDNYKAVSKDLELFALEPSINTPMMFPFHDGAVRYFKERGVWTAQMQKNNDELVDRYNKLEKLFNEVTIQAMDQKVSDANFAKFWLEKRNAAFPAFWKESK